MKNKDLFSRLAYKFKKAICIFYFLFVVPVFIYFYEMLYPSDFVHFCTTFKYIIITIIIVRCNECCGS